MVLNLPEPDESYLPGSPLELVVCEIRFETKVAAAESSTALSFHEAVGGSDGAYTRVEPVTQQTVTMVMGPAGPAATPSVEARGLTGWRFADDAGNWTLSLMPDRLALETSAYETWDGFRDRLHLAIAAAEVVVAPRFLQRVGLRYIDRIRELELRAPAEWGPYIAPELLGVASHPQLGPALRNAQQQLLVDLGRGFFCTLRHGFVVEGDGEPTVDYLLDYDLFGDAGRRFDREELIGSLEYLSNAALQLFQASVTNELLERFRG